PVRAAGGGDVSRTCEHMGATVLSRGDPPRFGEVRRRESPDSGSLLPRPSHPVGRWHRRGRSPFTVVVPCRIHTGFLVPPSLGRTEALQTRTGPRQPAGCAASHTAGRAGASRGVPGAPQPRCAADDLGPASWGAVSGEWWPGSARCGGAGYDEGVGEAHPGEDRTEVRPGVDEGLRDGGNQLPGRSAVLCRTTRWVASSMR